jgi:hypothetical protein
MRAAEEPLKGDLDVKELKAQVLGGMETLEDQDRERQGLLAELAPLLEGHGCDAEVVGATLGG